MALMKDPIERFHELFAEAKSRETHDATAMALATADAEGRPSVRMVLLKGADESGFTFFTNFGSRKAQEIAARPQAALCIHWPVMAVQVRVEGPVEAVSTEEADAYFATRPRRSQLGAWASVQSAPLPGRPWLVARYLRFAGKFAGQDVPRPEFWGGFRVIPDRIELWYNQEYRLHDRLLYTRQQGIWHEERLYP
jgi:pyridoxamine 5'-phosphate oxidase